ncbi:MAG: NUDIX domain-containing protein [Candidatus Doudnabacteria bacterium]|nr:NUDIX domain-containing protein [Candidatus Doudnabacteria bacterium]
MILQVGVKVLLKNHGGKYLLLKRNPEKYSGLSVWDIPGGRIEAGVSLLENLKREVLEETGLKISGVRLVAAQDILKSDKHVVRLTYVGSADGEIKIGEEHTEAKWFSAEEVSGLGAELDSYIALLIKENLLNL